MVIILKECANTKYYEHLHFMDDSEWLMLSTEHGLLVLGNYLLKVSYKLEGIVVK
jgi:hypothetical protein